MATRTSLKKSICILHSLWRLFLPTYFVNCRQTLLKLNFKRPYLSSEREIKFCCCLFTFSNERKIGHFHVVVVQKQERNVQKCDAHAKLLFCSLNLSFLWRFRCWPCRCLPSLLERSRTRPAKHVSVTSEILDAQRPIAWMVDATNCLSGLEI